MLFPFEVAFDVICSFCLTNIMEISSIDKIKMIRAPRRNKSNLYLNPCQLEE
jgi:hypothetical protein